MSYAVQVIISCDVARCHRTWSVSWHNRGGLTKTFAAALAQRAGWTVSGKPGSTDPKVARCPEHRP